MTIAEAETSPRRRDPAEALGTRFGDGADDPVTGPMPAIELRDGHVRVHVRRDVTIVTLDGGLDDALADAVCPVLGGVLAGAGAVVLDLDQVTLLGEGPCQRLLQAFEAATAGLDRCVVASRLSGRMVLERWGVTAHHGVFTSVADALQARAFLANGYGAGWQPTDEDRR
jgi:anti-anti-sigma regulatory factor